MGITYIVALILLLERRLAIDHTMPTILRQTCHSGKAASAVLRSTSADLDQANRNVIININKYVCIYIYIYIYKKCLCMYTH